MNRPQSGAGPRAVRRRKVYYVSGFDPRGAYWYHSTYREEAAKQAALSGMRIEVSRRRRPSEHVVSWTVAAETGGIATDTEYLFLRWDDIVRSYWPKGLSRLWGMTYAVVFKFWRSGVLGRVLRTSWPTFICGTFPIGFLTGLAVVGIAAGVALGASVMWLAALPMWTLWIIALVAALAIMAAGTPLLDRWFSIHWLTRIYAFSILQKDCRVPELDRRLEDFAALMVAETQAGDVDEVLIVGHSTGVQTAVMLLARALALDPQLGRRGPVLSLLTLGGSIPMISWWPEAGWFRDELRRVALDPSLHWTDFTIAQDGACFALHDPVESSGIILPPGDEPRPKLLSVKFFDLFSPARFKAIRRRWLRVHFQYLMAGERLADYDYFAITAGPLTLGSSFSHRESARNFDRFKLKIFGR